MEQQWVAQIRDELDGYFVTLKQLGAMEPDQVMYQLSAITARLSELRMHLCRHPGRRFDLLRTKELDPLIVECDRQYKFHSRIHAIRTFDWEVSGKGQV